MGTSSEAFQSVVERQGAVDLAQLTLPPGHEDRIDSVSFRSVSGVWYNLEALETTRLKGGLIVPVHLEAGTEILTPETAWIPLFAANAMKNYALERRHFPHNGNVAVVNDVIRYGDRLAMNGHTTRKLASAWVTKVALGNEPRQGRSRAYFGWPPR